MPKSDSFTSSLLPKPLTSGSSFSSVGANTQRPLPTSSGSLGNSNSLQHAPAPQRSNVTHSSFQTQKDELARVFNTVLVSTQSKGKRDFSAEVCELTESAPFKAILSAVRQLSRIHGLTERQASEQIIQTFRKMDSIWGEYVFREGLEKIKSSK